MFSKKKIFEVNITKYDLIDDSYKVYKAIKKNIKLPRDMKNETRACNVICK